MTKKKTRPPAASAAAKLLVGYRRKIADLLARAEVVAPAEPAELRLAVAALVENLNRDLLHLYRLAESGTLTRGDQLIAVPALERLRDTLRQRGVRLRAMSDTLHKALLALPANS